MGKQGVGKYTENIDQVSLKGDAKKEDYQFYMDGRTACKKTNADILAYHRWDDKGT